MNRSPRPADHPASPIALLAGIGIALVVLGPVLRPGFVLTYDMAFVPHARISRDLLGLGTGVPRSVPFGLLVAMASRVLPGWVVQKIVLFAILAGGAWGAARVLPGIGKAGRVGAALLFVWNPFVYERILLGHAAFLLSYAAFPWVVSAALGVRAGRLRAFERLVVALAVAGFASPYGGVIAGGVALAVTAFPGGAGGWWRRIGWPLVAAIGVDLPWLVPLLLRPGGTPSPSIAMDLFRSRSDSPIGLVGSLLSLGGTWRTDLAPPGRDTLAWVLAFVLIVAIAVLGWRTLVRSRFEPAGTPKDRTWAGAMWGLAVATAIGLVLALGIALPGVGHLIRWTGVHVPGGGILRDGQKFVAPLALLLSLCFGAGIDAVVGERREAGEPGRSRLAAASLIAVLPVALAPTLAWGASGRLFTTPYPADWARARAIMAGDDAPGGLLVLPWHLYLPYAWNRGRAVIQPAPAFFTRPVLESTALEVGRIRLPPEEPWSRLADPVVRSGRPLVPQLPTLGVRYVLVLEEADWRLALPSVAGLEQVFRGSDLILYRSAVHTRVPSFDTAPWPPVVAGDAVAIALIGTSLIMLRRWRRPPQGD